MIRIVGRKDLQPAPFEDEVHDMGDFVNSHPEILGDKVRIVSRELEHGPDGRRLDFLVYDADSNQPGIVELKRDVADEKVLLQTLRYADWLRNNPDTIRYQISRQGLDINPEEIDDSIKIVIVAPRIEAVVAELAQYISGFEFEFIQVQRFKDSAGEFLAVTNPLEVPNRSVAPSRSRLDEFGFDDYRELGYSSAPLEVLDDTVTAFSNTCIEQGWGLAPRMREKAIKFQTGGGRLVLVIKLRQRKDHYVRFCLGTEFAPGSVEIAEEVRVSLQHKPESRWWELPLQTAPPEAYLPLLREAYRYVTGNA